MKTKSTWILLTLLLGFGVSIFLLQSCDKIKEVTTFKVKYDLPDNYFTVDTSTLLKTELLLYSKTYAAINMDSIVGANNGLVDSVCFYKLKFSIVTPETAKLDWINSARVTITPEGGSPIELASSATINELDRIIDFKMNKLDITSPIKKPFVISLYGTLNGKLPTLPMSVLMESGIEITISPL
jgi:hypothetical protein